MQISSPQGGLSTASAMGAGQAAQTPGAESSGLPPLFNVFNIGDTLTANDKKLVGWEPNSGKINTLAIALAGYRHNGAITGEVTSSFVDALRNSIASTGGWPLNPAMLMAQGAQQSPLSSGTYSALYSFLGQVNPNTSA